MKSVQTKLPAVPTLKRCLPEPSTQQGGYSENQKASECPSGRGRGPSGQNRGTRGKGKREGPASTDSRSPGTCRCSLQSDWQTLTTRGVDLWGQAGTQQAQGCGRGRRQGPPQDGGTAGAAMEVEPPSTQLRLFSVGTWT